MIDNAKELFCVYEEHGRIYRYYCDWRHRVFNRFAMSIGASLYFAYEMETKKQDIISEWGILLAIFIIGISLVSLAMDDKNARVIKAIEEACSDMESSLIGCNNNVPLYYKNELDNEGISYKWIMRSIYGCGVFFGAYLATRYWPV